LSSELQFEDEMAPKIVPFDMTFLSGKDIEGHLAKTPMLQRLLLRKIRKSRGIIKNFKHLLG
jgi:hypothetical protein